MIKKFMTASGSSATTGNQYTDEVSDLVITTPFLNVEKVTLPQRHEQCIVYDLSGQGRYREQWQYFYPDVDGIFFVVDSSDHERISINQEILHEMARHPGLANRNIPFIIMGNKQDDDKALPEVQLRRALQVDRLKTMNDMKYWVQNTTGITGQGVLECFKIIEGKV